MAIEYSIKIETELTPHQVRALLTRSPLLSVRNDVLQGTGVNDAEIFAESTLGKSIVSDNLGFRPSVVILMHVDKEAVELGEDTVAQILALILQEFRGPVALIYNYEVVLAVRTIGQLVLNKDADFWSPERVKLIKFPHKLSSIPNLQ